MNHSWEHLPTLDWELTKKLAGNQIDLAKDMLTLFTKELVDDMHTIQTLATQKKYTALYKHIHRLHGAAAYCGTPRLKEMLCVIEKHCQNKELDSLPTLLRQLNNEVNNLIQTYRAEH